MSPSWAFQYPSPRRLARYGPLVDVLISSGRPEAPVIEATAMIDTGASVTFVTRDLIEHAGLTVLKTTPALPISTVNGDDNQRSPVYAAQISIVGLPQARITRCYRARFIPGTADVLLGRDLLRRGTFVYDGPRGRITLSHNG